MLNIDHDPTRVFAPRSRRRWLTGSLIAAFFAVSEAPAQEPPPPPAPQPGAVYRAVMLRAAPGRLLELIDVLRERRSDWQTAGDAAPILMRHSQGDHWDLLLLQPIGSMAEWWGEARQARWRQAVTRGIASEASFELRLEPLVAWREELFVEGPSVDVFRARDANAGFYHVEIFLALAGKRAELAQQRRIENDYLVAIGRERNLVFTRIAGAAWDLFTLGFYRDLQHYAEPATMTPEQMDAAAQAAGFRGRDYIGSYLRELIASHHDTLATRVR